MVCFMILDRLRKSLILSSKHTSKDAKMLYSPYLSEVTQKLVQITCSSLLHCFWLWINLFWQTNTTSKKHLMRNIPDWTGWKYVQKSQLDRVLTCVSRYLTIRTCLLRLLRPSVFENKWYLKAPHGLFSSTVHDSTLPETASLPLKIGWLDSMQFPFGMALFEGAPC